MCSEEYLEKNFVHASSNYYFVGKRTVGFDYLNLAANFPRFLG